MRINNNIIIMILLKITQQIKQNLVRIPVRNEIRRMRGNSIFV